MFRFLWYIKLDYNFNNISTDVKWMRKESQGKKNKENTQINYNNSIHFNSKI